MDGRPVPPAWRWPVEDLPIPVRLILREIGTGPSAEHGPEAECAPDGRTAEGMACRNGAVVEAAAREGQRIIGPPLTEHDRSIPASDRRQRTQFLPWLAGQRRRRKSRPTTRRPC
jgi:hypothetical protein